MKNKNTEVIYEKGKLTQATWQYDKRDNSADNIVLILIVIYKMTYWITVWMTFPTNQVPI